MEKVKEFIKKNKKNLIIVSSVIGVLTIGTIIYLKTKNKSADYDNYDDYEKYL